MNQIVVDKIVEQLNRVNSIAEVQRIVEEKNLKNGSLKNGNLKNFSADYLVEEFRKISHAKEKNYPTHRSEYRVIKTLIRLRNEIIYELKQSPDFSIRTQTLLMEFIDLSKYLFDTLADVSRIFETEKNISSYADEFDNTWKS